LIKLSFLSGRNFPSEFSHEERKKQQTNNKHSTCLIASTDDAKPQNLFESSKQNDFDDVYRFMIMKI